MAFPHDLDPNMPGYWDREKLAFTLWVAHLIAEASGRVEHSEQALLARLFPPDRLAAYGIVDADGDLTPVWESARDEAVRKLRDVLDLRERLELVTVFHQVCLADASLVQPELLVLREAAEALGVNVTTLSAHLRALEPR